MEASRRVLVDGFRAIEVSLGFWLRKGTRMEGMGIGP